MKEQSQGHAANKLQPLIRRQLELGNVQDSVLHTCVSATAVSWSAVHLQSGSLLPQAVSAPFQNKHVAFIPLGKVRDQRFAGAKVSTLTLMELSQFPATLHLIGVSFSGGNKCLGGFSYVFNFLKSK